VVNCNKPPVMDIGKGVVQHLGWGFFWLLGGFYAGGPFPNRPPPSNPQPPPPTHPPPPPPFLWHPQKKSPIKKPKPPKKNKTVLPPQKTAKRQQQYPGVLLVWGVKLALPKGQPEKKAPFPPKKKWGGDGGGRLNPPTPKKKNWGRLLSFIFFFKGSETPKDPPKVGCLTLNTEKSQMFHRPHFRPGGNKKKTEKNQATR